MPPFTRSCSSLRSSVDDEVLILKTTDGNTPSTPKSSIRAALKRSKYFTNNGEVSTPTKKGRTSGTKKSPPTAKTEQKGAALKTPTKSSRSIKSPNNKSPSKAKMEQNGAAFNTPTKSTKSSGSIKSPKAKSPSKAKTEQKGAELKTPTKSTKKSPKSSSKAKSPSPRKRRIKIEPGTLPPPVNWERTYALVEELRSDKTAPVDTDGAEALPEKHLGEVVYRFQVLIALMLSSQTKDAVVGETIKALQKHGLTVENIQRTDNESLNALIQKVGFHNNKTKYIKESAEMIIAQYNGDIPQSADEMMKLPGVGPKMAYIVESIAFKTNSGIGVDTHMHRMFNDLKWVNSTTPEGTREQLEGWLPRERWGEVNALWVGFGQEVQQQKEKMLKKAIESSSPREALGLIQKLRLDVKKEGERFGLENAIKRAMDS